MKSKRSVGSFASVKISKLKARIVYTAELFSYLVLKIAVLIKISTFKTKLTYLGNTAYFPRLMLGNRSIECTTLTSDKFIRYAIGISFICDKLSPKP